MSDLKDVSGYEYSTAQLSGSHEYLLPSVLAELERHRYGAAGRRIFELGCGNGAVAALLRERGYDVTGVDASTEGIARAREQFPHLDLRQRSAYEDLAADYGRFPVVLSLEVVEHLYAPRKYAQTVYDLLEPGGIAIISTPYHGYWKNLAIALAGKMDAHYTALWDHGHIKFWSVSTLGTLLREAGFGDIVFHRVGRIPALAKSMIAVARKPGRKE